MRAPQYGRKQTPKLDATETANLKRLRIAAYIRQKNRCYWCGKTNLRRGDPSGEWHPDTMTAEHLVRRADGGQNTAENVVAACAQCNSGRERWPDGIPRVRVKAITRPRIFCDPE
ncbi:HNH endonuclease [Methylorubrum thiocyanatum]|uniref:HNH endonuclease n=1 Tax=Methylorubrum thiocyanatum TaxID=47958 RepID=UPI00383A1BCB